MSAADDLARRVGALRPQVPSDLGPSDVAYRIGFDAGKTEALREARREVVRLTFDFGAYVSRMREQRRELGRLVGLDIDDEEEPPNWQDIRLAIGGLRLREHRAKWGSNE